MLISRNDKGTNVFFTKEELEPIAQGLLGHSAEKLNTTLSGLVENTITELLVTVMGDLTHHLWTDAQVREMVRQAIEAGKTNG